MMNKSRIEMPLMGKISVNQMVNILAHSSKRQMLKLITAYYKIHALNSTIATNNCLIQIIFLLFAQLFFALDIMSSFKKHSFGSKKQMLPPTTVDMKSPVLRLKT